MPTNDDATEIQRKVALLGTLVRRYAWCRIQPAYFPDDVEYLLVIELPDGRRFWRVFCTFSKTPDEMMLLWAGCPPAKWFDRLSAEGRKKKANWRRGCPWNEYFDFWAKPNTSA